MQTQTTGCPSGLLVGPKKEKEDIMEQPGLHGRHRDKNGELSKKHGNTLVRTLRKVYGEHFAEGCSPEERLSDVLQKMDEPSLSRLVHDHEHHKLYELIDQAPER
jgi:hypothetical protein